MNALNVIKNACREALDEEMDEIPAWRAAYVSIVDPLSVLEMAEYLETLLMHADEAAPELAAKIRQEINFPKP